MGCYYLRIMLLSIRISFNGNGEREGGKDVDSFRTDPSAPNSPVKKSLQGVCLLVRQDRRGGLVLRKLEYREGPAINAKPLA